MQKIREFEAKVCMKLFRVFALLGCFHVLIRIYGLYIFYFNVFLLLLYRVMVCELMCSVLEKEIIRGSVLSTPVYF